MWAVEGVSRPQGRRQADETEVLLTAIAMATGYYSFPIQLCGTGFDAAEQPYALTVI
jgi:hypothetical protein